jgi:drug/metabolite transporter (DMT)-like permease
VRSADLTQPRNPDEAGADQMRLAYALLLVAPVLFASNMLVARWVQGDIPPVAMAFWRWTLTWLFLLPLTWRPLWANRREIARDWPTLLLLGTLGMGLCGAPVYLAGATTTATNIGLIYAASPILIVLIDRLGWSEPVGRRQALGIGLSVFGVLAIVLKGDPTTLLGLDFARGDLWTVLAACSWALYSVLLKRRPSRLSLVGRFGAIVMFGALVNLPFYGLEMALGRVAAFDAYTAAVVTFLAISPGIGAYLAYGRLVAVFGPGRTSVLMYLVPLYNVVLAYVLLGETPQAYHLAGTALILPGVYLATAPRAARA